MQSVCFTLIIIFKIGSGEDEIKRGKFGFNFLAGFQLDNGLNIHGGYGLGITGVTNNPDGFGDLKFKNRVFSIGLRFTFLVKTIHFAS